MSTEMAEACGFCYGSFLPTRKINEPLKCACQRPFFSQTVARSNLPTDRDCWIEVPKRFVRHYSALFGETVNFEGDDCRSYCCVLVGIDIAIVGYGFDWYDFASSHNVCIGDQVVFTLMEKSRFLVQVYRANPQTVPLATVKVEQDVDVQVAAAQDWLQAKAKRSGTNITVKAEAQRKDSKRDNTESENDNAESDEASTSSTSDSDCSLRGSKRDMFDTRKRSEPNDSAEVSDDETSGATMSNDRIMCSRLLYVQKNRGFAHYWGEPGTTRRKPYVSKRRPVTCAEKERALEAAKLCPITHNSYLRQVEKDNVYRALVLAIPAPWLRENMPRTKHSYKATLADEEGNCWESTISGREIFWGNFSLDHCLEEDDVVVMELVDSRIKSVKFLVHIFRVVDVTMSARGKAGWPVHYTLVDGIKKKEARRELLTAQGKRKTSSASGRQLKSARASSHLKISRFDRTIETPPKRLTRLQAALQSSQKTSVISRCRTVDSKHDSDDSLPSQHARDSNNRGLTPQGTDRCRSDCEPGSRAGPSTEQKTENKSGKQCCVCFDAPAEAVCTPCGHLAGCMNCLTAIKYEDWVCPVCGASIHQVVKMYAV